jgi:hypothetical protein
VLSRPATNAARIMVLMVLLTLLTTVGNTSRAYADDDEGRDGEDEIRKRGACSSRSMWRLRTEADDGRIEIRFVIRSRGPGRSWTYTIRQGGTVAAAGRRTTKGKHGRLRVRRTIPDDPGIRTLTATARNLRTREYCRAAVNI